MAAALHWEEYAKLRIPLSKRLKEHATDDKSLAELETLAENVLDRMDAIPRDHLDNPECYDDLRMMHREELGSIRAERRRSGCPSPLTQPMDFTFDFAQITWNSCNQANAVTIDDVKTACPELFVKTTRQLTQRVQRMTVSSAARHPVQQYSSIAERTPVAQPSPPSAAPRPSMRAFLPKKYDLPNPSVAKHDLPSHDMDDAADDSDRFHSMKQPSRGRPQQQHRNANPFQTAGEKLEIDKKSGQHKDSHRGATVGKAQPNRSHSYHPINPNVLMQKKQNSPPRIHKPFNPPDGSSAGRKPHDSEPPPAADDPADDVDPRLKSCDPELISKIEMEIVDAGDPVSFDDIAGLSFAKKCVNELVIWPMARPDIFTGLRSLPKGLLLFGPPGTGKTLIGKAIATQSGATFFSISASSLTSKWIGEGEKLVRTLFAVAAVKQPSVIFIDEIDSLLSQRSSTENEASRRMKTEFLVQLDGAGTKSKDIILVVGATNRPQELDEAARRRFVKRLYIPLPSAEARLDLMNRLLAKNQHDLTDADKSHIVQRSKGFSGADVRSLCTEAAMGPIRNCVDIQTMQADDVRPISRRDFDEALRGTRSSVSVKDLQFYMEWNAEFGSYQIDTTEMDDDDTGI
ncbi:hypothetical protein, variant 1 [Aphanomyces astaci]|uniref:AAA+ ATPase domain-containing protein n=1 Tax=Aphanomyces astaci TaxID=112090 RepID=W4H468_APHAT|nr:hypothetical protein, variant 1 [Aphanomyces astaci]ETV85943.1 hypothetical protein, variant 1 [Aphanomyces astaci]|eukprot:XP_009824416.1 hypothetical protein, variant 1 [Aphanomyces astaci]